MKYVFGDHSFVEFPLATQVCCDLKLRMTNTNSHGQVSDVDTAIHVLISAGVSSPSLRMAAKRGVKIEGAGHAEVAVPQRKTRTRAVPPAGAGFLRNPK